MNREATMHFLNEALTALFPGHGVKVWERTIIGEANIHVRYTHNLDASTCNNRILENDPAFMHFYIERERDVWVIDYPSTHCNRLMGKGKPLNFRKIRAKSENEAATKLLQWFTKHRDLILTAPQVDL